MAVQGVGIDLVSIPTFSAQLATPGTRFAEIFSVGERRDAAESAGDAAASLAARWAVKEAVFKAWSSGRFSEPATFDQVNYREIEVITDALGRPAVKLSGKMRELLTGLVIHISLTHEAEMAAAVVIVESA